MSKCGLQQVFHAIKHSNINESNPAHQVKITAATKNDRMTILTGAERVFRSPAITHDKNPPQRSVVSLDVKKQRQNKTKPSMWHLSNLRTVTAKDVFSPDCF